MTDDSAREALEALAEEPLDDADTVALSRVRHLVETIDPVPDGLIARLHFAITLDGLETEVASLTAGSALVGAHRADDVQFARTVSFSTADVAVMITLTDEGGTVRIDGWTTPERETLVDLQVGDVSDAVVTDADGRFVFDAAPHGLAQFILRPLEGQRTTAVVIPAIEI